MSSGYLKVCTQKVSLYLTWLEFAKAKIFSQGVYSNHLQAIVLNFATAWGRLAKKVFLAKVKETILKFVWNHQRLQITKALLRKKHDGDNMHPDFKLYNKAIIREIVLYYLTSWHLLKQNRKPKLNPRIYGQLIFNKGAKNPNGKKIISSTNCAGKTGGAHAEQRNWPVSHPIHRRN